MNATPILEAINAPEQDIDGVRKSLLAMHNLAIVFPESKSDSPVYGYNQSSRTLRFPPSLASVIYAAFHKEDDAAYFGVIAEAVTGNAVRAYVDRFSRDLTKDAGLRYDPASKRIVPAGRTPDTSSGLMGPSTERIHNARYLTSTPGYNGTDGAGGLDTNNRYREYRYVIAGILNHPERLKEIGSSFGVYLLDLLDHVEEKQNEKALLGDVKHILNTYRKRYVAELSSEKGVYTGEYATDDAGNPITKTDKDGNTVNVPEIEYLEPKLGNRISQEELYVYIACRMSESYGTDIPDKVHAIETYDAWYWSDNRDPANEPKLPAAEIQDTTGFVKNWIEEEGLPPEAEYQTGEGRSEYLALNIGDADLDLSGAPVAPAYLIPLFAKDCSSFNDVRGSDPISDPKMLVFAYQVIAGALGLSTQSYSSFAGEKEGQFSAYIEYMRDTINSKIASLVRDSATAQQVHASAVAFLKKKAAKSGDDAQRGVIDRIRTQVFQDKGDGYLTQYPGVSGTGDEVFLRRTSVSIGNITTRILRAVKKYSNAFEVESDDKESGKIVVRMGDDTVTLDKHNPESAGEYVLPKLFSYLDSTSSYSTYAVWKGIVPYSRVIDNKLEYLNDDSASLYSARAGEADRIVGDVLTAGLGRNSAVSLTGSVDSGIDNASPEFQKDAILQTIPKPKTQQRLSNEEIAQQLNAPALRAYSIMTNIADYSANLNQAFNSSLNPKDAPAKLAFRDVYGNIPTMVSDETVDELFERVADKAVKYAMAIKGNGLNSEIRGAGANVQFDNLRKEVKAYSKEFADELFDSLKTMDIPGEIASAYGNDEHAMLTAMRTMLYDLSIAAMSIAQGYGYHGLNVTNTYSGGKYTSGNRIMVDFENDGTNAPIFNFGAAGTMRGIEDIENDRKVEFAIAKKASELLSDSTIVSNNPDRNTVIWGMCKRLLRSLNVENGVKEAAVDKAAKSIVHEGSQYSELENIYAVLFATLSTLILDGPVTRDVNTGMLRSIGGAEAIKGIETTIKNIRNPKAQKILGKLEENRKTLRVLTDNGKLIRGLTDAFKGSSVGDSYEYSAYAKLASAAVGAINSIKDIETLKQSIAGFFKTDPRKMSRIPESETVPLDTVGDEVEAPENGFNLYDQVETALGEWKPNASGLYTGLTGFLGFDTIKVGNTTVTSTAMTPLTSGETAFTGLNKAAVDKCAGYIQSSRDELEDFTQRNGQGITNIGEMSVKQLWADELIDFIGSNYMETKMNLVFARENGGIVLNEDTAEEWMELVKSIIAGIQTRCGRNIADTAAIRNEINKFVTENLVIARGDTLDEVSKVSTAFAHIILRVGDLTRQQAVPNPFAGHQVPTSKIPPELRTVAKQRSLGDVGTSQQDASALSRDAYRSVVSDDMLARELESIYNDLQMNATEGADRYLDYFAAAIHKADNKHRGTEREINLKLAPNADAAKMYACILDDEGRNDKEYSSLVQYIKERYAEGAFKTIGQLLSGCGLLSGIKNSPLKGNSYAGAAFGNQIIDNISGQSTARMLKNRVAMENFVKALRIQIVDNLLDNRSFEWLKKNMPETMDKFANIFFSLATNLTSGHAATIFASLDPAERNAGHFARLKQLKDEMDDESTLGTLYDSDEAMKAATAQYPNREIKDMDALTRVLSDLVDAGSGTSDKAKTGREDAIRRLKAIAGDVGVKYIQAKLTLDSVKDIIANGSPREKDYLVDNLAKRIANVVAADPRKTFNAASRVQAVEAKLYDRLSDTIYDIYTKRGNQDDGSKEAVKTGVRFVNDVFGDASANFISDVLWSIKSKNVKPDEVRDYIEKMVDDFRSGKSIYPEMIERYARKAVAPKGPAARKEHEANRMLGEPDNSPMIGSTNTQSRRMREVGGDYGTSFVAPGKAENFNAYKDAVRKELNSFDVARGASDKTYRNAFSSYLKGMGFEGSIESFCNDVLNGNNVVDKERQNEIASKYASRASNYNMTALNKWMNSAIGSTAREAALTPKGGHLDDETILKIARSDIPHIHLATDKDGNETDQIVIGDSKPLPIHSPDARARMTLVVNRAEKLAGLPLFKSDGKIDRVVASAIGKVVEGNTSPVDPSVSTDRLAEVVSSILTNNYWATVKPNGHFVRSFNVKGKDGQTYGFNVTFGKDTVQKYVRSLVASKFGGDTYEKLRQEMIQYVTRNKVFRTGTLPSLETSVKDGIDATAKKMAVGLIKSGDSVISKDGITVTRTGAK